MPNSVVAALKTHTILAIQGFQSGETSSIPGACVPLATEDFSAYEWLSPSLYEGFPCRSGTASEDLVSMTDEKPTRASVGLMGQVASCRPSPPSSHDEVIERPGWQPRGLPDLSNFD
jgi:hypothetical protein